MNTQPRHVLFLCTGNSARSVMAEALMNSLGRGRFIGHSAGSMPTGKVNPFALDLLQREGHEIAALRSKSWDEFASSDHAQGMDFIFTVCDNAAGEVCPIWPGTPVNAHWGLPDPAAATGTDAEIAAAFADVYRMIRMRLEAFVNLPVESLDRMTLDARLKEIGKGQTPG